MCDAHETQKGVAPGDAPRPGDALAAGARAADGGGEGGPVFAVWLAPERRFGRLRAVLALVALVAAFAAAYATSPEHARSYTKTFAPGAYACARCGTPLFRSDDKFDSGTRWPSFRAAVPGAVATRLDTSLGLERTEILCARCGLHLGHVFPDGRLTGDTHPDADLRFCALSESLDFRPATTSGADAGR